MPKLFSHACFRASFPLLLIAILNSLPSSLHAARNTPQGITQKSATQKSISLGSPKSQKKIDDSHPALPKALTRGIITGADILKLVTFPELDRFLKNIQNAQQKYNKAYPNDYVSLFSERLLTPHAVRALSFGLQNVDDRVRSQCGEMLILYLLEQAKHKPSTEWKKRTKKITASITKALSIETVELTRATLEKVDSWLKRDDYKLKLNSSRSSILKTISFAEFEKVFLSALDTQRLPLIEELGPEHAAATLLGLQNKHYGVRLGCIKALKGMIKLLKDNNPLIKAINSKIALEQKKIKNLGAENINAYSHELQSFKS